MSQQQQQHQHHHSHYAHVASSASGKSSNENNDMYMYGSFYESSMTGGINMGGNYANNSSGDGSGAIPAFDLETRGSNSVAYAHNQLLQYQQQQNAHLSQHNPPGVAAVATQRHGYMNPKVMSLQHHMNQYQMQNHMSCPPIEVEELIIKSEPPDENYYKTNFIDDKAPIVDFKKFPDFGDEMLNPKDELNIKEEHPSDMQQKCLNFPRRKVQTERSETLPICQRCKQVFFKKHVYINHVTESSCDIVEYDLRCSICPMSFMSVEELEKHKQMHRENKFFCHKYCGKHYDTISDVETHEYMHHEYETLVCNICSLTFATRELLYAHLPHHKFQQRFDCSVCRLWFATPQELHEHRIGAPYFCGKYYIIGGTQNQRSLFHNPTAPKFSSEHQTNYKLQDCRMGVMEIPPNHIQPSTAVPNATITSSFITPSHTYQHAHYKSNNFFQTPSIKTEIKVEPDFYSNIADYPQHHSQITPQNFSDYTNDSYTSSHNSSSFTNEYNETSSSMLNAQQQQAQTANASTLDDSEDAICCVPRCCVRKSTSPTLQFFTFPKDDKYLHQWLSNLKMLHVSSTIYQNYRICSLHFPKRCINRYSLCYWAVPTFNLGHDDVANLYQNRELTNTFTTGEVARCSMPNCKSQRGESNVKFYNFPKDIKSLIKWCQNARLPVQAKEPRHFCGRHFEERCIGKFRLKPWAVPTLNLGTPYGKIHDNPQNLYVEEKRCCLPFCRRSRSSDFNMSLYRFPRDEVLLQRWCYNLRLDPSVYRGKNHKICSAHFIKEALGLRKLSPGAVPTLNLGHNDTFNIYENELYTPPPPPPPSSSAQKGYYRQPNATSTVPSPSSSLSSMFYAPDTVSPFSSITNASSTPNVTESMDVCCVPGCESKRHNSSDITFHTIPRRPEQMQKWCHNLKMDDDKMHKGLRICSLHFEPYCIGGCMRPFAVPTLNLGHNDENIYKNPDVIKKLNIRETCCVQICKRNRERDHANLHRFPANPVMMAKWCDNLHKPVPDGSRLFNDAICEVHFEDRCLRNKRLEKWSVPTLNLGYDELVHKLPTESEVAELFAKPSAPNNGDEDGECCVDSCKRNPQIDDVKLYRAPEDLELLAKWAHNLQIDVDDLSNLRICNLHFESHCIGKRMHFWAIPTLNLGTKIENMYENREQPIFIKKEKPLKFYGDTPSSKATWVPRCCLGHCRKMRAIHNVQLFRFPNLNRPMLAKWCHNLQMPLVGSAQRRVCSVHFDPAVLSKKCPIPHSVPTIDLNTPPGYKIYQNPARLKAPKQCLQRVCIIESCQRKRTDGVQLFRFPHNYSVLRKWLHNIKQRPKGSSRAQWRVCTMHFEPHSFNGKRLSNGAIPTLNLGHDDEDIYPNEAQSFIDEQCVIQGCEAIKDMPDVRLFRFPTEDEDLLWKWCNNLKMNPIDCRDVRICNKHFDSKCIGPKHLFKWAIPTLNLGHYDSEIELIPNPNPEDRYVELIFKCCVPTCGKTRKYDEVQLNSFPKDPKQFRRWKYNLKLEYLDFKERDKYKICSTHFEDICIGKSRLNIGAIPTVNLGHNDMDRLYQVKPEKLQSNLFGKNRTISIDSATSKDSSDEEESIENDSEVILPDSHSFNEQYSDNQMDSEDLIVASEDLNMSQVKMKTSLDMLKCCVKTCQKSRLQHGVHLFNFPSGPIQLKKWRHNLQIPMSSMKKLLRICNLHFNKRCIDGKQLRSWAVPTMNLGHSDPIYENPKNIPGFFLPVCALNHCRKRRTIDNDLRTYQFPKGHLLEKWCANLKLQPENCRGRICADHFEDEVRGKLKLKTGAVPTLNIGHSDALLFDNEAIKSTYEKRYDSHEKQSEMSIDENEPDVEESICDTEEGEEFYDPLKFVETVDEQLEEDTFEEPIYMPILTYVKKEKPVNNVSPICCLKHCRKEKTAQQHLSTFGFPKDRQLLLKWCANLHLNPDECIGRVCIEHFDPEVLGSRKLRQGAVPTINVGHDEPLRYSNNGCELPIEIYDVDSSGSDNRYESTGNSPTHYAEKLDHSVFRLFSLKHCRKRGNLEKSDETSTRNILHDSCSLNFPTDLSFCCCVPKCGKSRLKDGARLNRFPKSRTLYLKWIHNLKLKSTVQIKNTYKVCNDHFESYCLEKGFLKEGAVPTLKLGHSYFMIYRNSKKLQGKKNSFNVIIKCMVPNCLSENLHVNKMYPIPAYSQLNSAWQRIFNFKNAEQQSEGHVCGLHFIKLFEDISFPQEISPSEKSELSKTYESIKQSVIMQKFQCSVPGCKSKYTDKIRLTRLPQNEELCKKWLHNTKIAYDKQRHYVYRVCLNHFEKYCITQTRPKLWALPTLQLNHNDNIYLNPKEHVPKIKNATLVKSVMKPIEIKIEPNLDVKQKIESPKRALKTCCIAHCDGQKILRQLFSFPSGEFQLQKWCVNTQKPIAEVRNLYVCAKHFESDAICKQQLRPWALPTIDLGHTNTILQNAKHLGNFHSEEQESNDMKYIRSNYCAVVSCFQKVGDAVRLYEYPTEMSLIRKWATNCKHRSFQARQHGLRICKEHFDIDCFMEGGILRSGAVPTLKLGLGEGQHIQQSEWIETRRKTPIPHGQMICCIVSKCDSVSGKDTRFYKFPKIGELLQMWCKNLRIVAFNDNKEKHICQLHFEMRCFTEHQRLHKGALPTLHLGHEYTNDVIQNPDSFERVESIPQCCVPGCNNTKQNDGVQLSAFPRFRNLFEKWANNLKLPISNQLWQNGKVCSTHFETYCYEYGRLKTGAMPTLLLGHNDTDINHTNELTLGKKRKAHFANRTNTPTLIKLDDFKCCYPSCKELDNPKMRQEFSLPTERSLRAKWCEMMNCDPGDTELRLCPLHFIINYEANVDMLKNLQSNESKSEENLKSISHLQTSYYTAKCNSRILAMRCSVLDCLTLAPRDNKKLYVLPYNQDLLEKWLHNTKIELIESQKYLTRVCSDHFEQRCISETSNRLKVWAIPTLSIPAPTDDEILYENPSAAALERNTAKCCIRNCENARDNVDIITVALYPFPKENDILQKWLYNTQLKARETFGGRVCAVHFEKFCIGKRLRNWAIPTLHLGHDLPDIYQNSSDKRVAQLKVEVVDSDESHMTSYSDQRTETETMDSSTFEPIVVMESLETEEFDDQTNNSTISNKCDSYRSKQEDLTADTKEYNLNSTDMALEVMLEVGHVEKCATYEQTHSSQPHTPISEQSLPSPSERIANARRCCIVGCSVRNTVTGMKLHKFPQSKDVLDKWMHNAQIEVDLRCPWRYRICSRHFEPECFNGYRFRYGTMPTLHLGPNRPRNIFENEFEQAICLQQDNSKLVCQDSDNEDHSDVDFELTTNQHGDYLANMNKSGKFCQIKGCRNHLKTDGISLHKFPQTPRLWKKWQHNTQIPININYPWRFRVCSEHFHPQCLSNSRLLFGSIPTMNLGPNAPEELYENEFQIESVPKLEMAMFEEKSADEYDEYDEALAIEPEIELQLNEDHSMKCNSNDFDCDNENSITFDEYFTKAAMGKCCIPGCNMNKASPGITLHKYPSPPDHLRKWLHNTQVKVDLSCRWRYRVCSRHFDPGCLRGPRIIYGCVPTLNLGRNTPSFIYNNEDVFKRMETESPLNNIPDEKPNITFSATSFTKLHCSITNCGRVSGQDGVSLHRLPQDEVTRRKWLAHCNFVNGPSQNHMYSLRICSRHFEKNCYIGAAGKRYLKPGVTPTLNLYKTGCENLSIQLIKQEKTFTTTLTKTNEKNYVFNEIKSGYGKCSLIHCQKQKSQHCVKIYKFPKSQQQQERWSHNLRIQYDPARPWKFLICGDHFEKQCVSKRKLYRWAVPTLNLGGNVPTTLFSNEQCKVLCVGFGSSSDDSENDEQSGKEVKLNHFADCKNVPKSTFDQTLSSPNVSYDSLPKHNFAYKTKICCLPHCRRPRGGGVKLFRLPTSVHLIRKWEHNTGIAFKESQRNTKLICSDHFPPSLIGIRRLSKNAVPTLNLGPNAPQNPHKNTVIESNEDTEDVVNRDSESKEFVITEIDTLENSEDFDDDEKLFDPMSIRSHNSMSNSVKQEHNDWQSNIDLRLPPKNMTYRQHHCCVPHCGLARRGNLKLFRVPLDSTLRAKWEQNLRMKFDINDRNINLICSQHFEPELIGATRLARGSVPTLNLKPIDATSSCTPDPRRPLATAHSSVLVFCNVPGCDNTNAHHDITIFDTYMRERDILNKWCENLNIDANNPTIKEGGYNICSAHFEHQCFTPQRNLHKWALPTLDLGHEGKAKHQVLSFDNLSLQCCVPKCQGSKGLNTIMFSFPTDELLRKKWFKVLQIDEKNHFLNRKVCINHFRDDNLNGSSLKPDAIPCLNLHTSEWRCIAKNCEAVNDLIKFPENRNTAAKWCHNLKIEPLPKVHLHPDYTICRRHFEPDCFRFKNLHSDAVPSLHLGHEDPNIFLNEDMSSPNYFESSSLHACSNSGETITVIKKEPVGIEEISIHAWQAHSWYTPEEDMVLGGS